MGEIATYPSEKRARAARERLAATLHATYDESRDVYVFQSDGKQKVLAIEQMPGHGKKPCRLIVKDDA